MTDYGQIADDLQAKVRKQNWKLGGALSMDCDEAAEAIAATLRAAHAAGVAAERERCAGIVETSRLGDTYQPYEKVDWGFAVSSSVRLCQLIAAAIRKGE